MIFTELPIKRAFLIEPERQEDERGFFTRTGFQTLEDETEVFHQISAPFHPESFRDFRSP